MRFLITGKNRFPMPPEMAPALVDATIAWAKGNRSGDTGGGIGVQ